MHIGRAFLAGVCGTVIMSLLMVGLRAEGVGLHIEGRLAGMLGMSGWGVGLLAYLVIGGLIGIIYALVFEWGLHQAGIGPGLLMGAYNSVFAGFIWAMVAGGPGPFWRRFGASGIAALFLVHFAYGAVVGALYKTEHVLVEGSFPATAR